MLSFTKIGVLGRLGNQMFQYAFLRTQAERLGVPFYCPYWMGDDIFTLGDSEMKAPLSDKIVSIYEEPIGRDYDRRKLLISDNTDIMGNFESEKNFDIFKARSWYSFRKEKLLGVKTKYSNMDFSKSVGLHLRLGDKQKEPYTKGIYFIPRIQYYIDALEAIKNYENILIFSDDIPASREYFNSITHHSVVYMEDNADWEDLYLMTQCHDFICGASTFSWWGAWLGKDKDKTVIFPQEGTFRPGSGFENSDFVADVWKTIASLSPTLDHYIFAGFPIYGINRRLKNKIGRWLKKYFPRFSNLLLHYFQSIGLYTK